MIYNKRMSKINECVHDAFIDINSSFIPFHIVQSQIIIEPYDYIYIYYIRLYIYIYIYIFFNK